MTVAELMQLVFSKGSGKKNDEGLIVGSEDDEGRAVGIGWFLTSELIEEAKQSGENTAIVHELVFFPWGNLPEDHMDWRANAERHRLVVENKINIIRAHGSMDEFRIFDDFAEQLGLGRPVVREGAFEKVYEIEPVSVRQLAERVKAAVGMEHIRVAAKDLDREVQRVGLPWGGLGLLVNMAYMQKLVELGCDVFVGGESDAYGSHFALESDIPFIETSHEASENFGLANIARWLDDQLPDIPVHYVEVPCNWRIC